MNLNKKKENLLLDIEKIKKMNNLIKSRLIEKNEDLTKSKNFIDENNKIQKNNLLKKYEIEIKEIESNLEENFIKNKSIILEKIIPNKNLNTSNFLENKNNELYENYQKVLEEQYEINCKFLKQEFSLNKIKEINKFTESMIIEKNEKLNEYKNNILNLENQYFNSLKNERENFKLISYQTDEFLKEKFNQSLINYDKIKKELISDSDIFINKFIEKLNKNKSEKYEIEIEEFLYQLKDKINLKFQKYKNSYDLLEGEYKYKILVMNYLLEILNNIIKNSIDNKDNNEQIIQNIINFSKDKIESYKVKYIKEKEKKLYPFLKDLKYIKINRNKSFNNIFYSKNNNNYDNKQIVKKSNKNEKQSIIFSSERISENENKEIENKINNNLNNNKNTINKINENEYYNFSKVKSNKIPSLKDYILNNLDDIEKSLYNEIIIFLSNEYLKVENIKKYGTITPYINLKLNILILDKIRLYTEDTFNYIHQNFSNWKFRMFFKEKLELLIINISDYKKNFLIDETKINNSNNKINHSYSTNNYFNKLKYNFISKYSI